MTSLHRDIRTAVIGGIVTVLFSLLLILMTGAWSSKEDASDHRADVQAVRADIRRVLDAVCTDKPNVPQCRGASTP